MKTYKVTFPLSGTLSVTFPKLPTFDGILSFGFVKEISRSASYRELYLSKVTDQRHYDFVKSIPYHSHIQQKMSYEPYELFDVSLMPIYNDKYFFASSIQLNKASFQHTQPGFVRRKYDTLKIRKSGMKQGTIRINSGMTKSTQIEFPLLMANEAVFYVMTDRPAEMLQLLQHIRGIGNKHNIQWGRTGQPILEPVDYDWEIINRPIPEKYCTPAMVAKTGNVISVYTAFWPPYHQTMPELCLLPNLK